jgi:hypothetical protein
MLTVVAVLAAFIWYSTIARSPTATPKGCCGRFV